MTSLLLAAPAHAVEVIHTDPAGAAERLTLDLGGFVQPRFTFIPQDDPGLVLSWKYGVELMPETRLQDAYVDVRVADPLQLLLGQFKSPTNRSLLTSAAPTTLPVLEQSSATAL